MEVTWCHQKCLQFVPVLWGGRLRSLVTISFPHPRCPTCVDKASRSSCRISFGLFRRIVGVHTVTALPRGLSDVETRPGLGQDHRLRSILQGAELALVLPEDFTRLTSIKIHDHLAYLYGTWVGWLPQPGCPVRVEVLGDGPKRTQIPKQLVIHNSMLTVLTY